MPVVIACYVRLSRVWIIACALAILIVGVVAWRECFTGRLDLRLLLGMVAARPGPVRVRRRPQIAARPSL